MEEKLRSFLKIGTDWARLKTNLPGVSVLKLPPFRGIPAHLAVELNLVDDAGNPTKRRGLIIRDVGELEEYQRIFQLEKIKPLLASVSAINPMVKRQILKPGEEVLEI